MTGNFDFNFKLDINGLNTYSELWFIGKYCFILETREFLYYEIHSIYSEDCQSEVSLSEEFIKSNVEVKLYKAIISNLLKHLNNIQNIILNNE